MKLSLKDKIDSYLVDLELSLIKNDSSSCSVKIQKLSSFVQFMSDEQRDFFNAMRFTFNNNLEWKSIML